MLDDETIEDVMKRVRRLEIRAKRLVTESFAGEYHSSFKGQGLDFDEFREYQHGDEIRFIDWNVTARMGTPFIRKFREERELSVIIAVDVSASTLYGSNTRSKRELAAELAAILGFSARDNGDKVGLLLFAEKPVLYLPPVKGTRQILRSAREILTSAPEQQRTSLNAACEFLNHTVRRKALVFLISDFVDSDFGKPLSTLAKKHETMAMRVVDPLEKRLPAVGRVILRDVETGRESIVNTNNVSVRMAYEKLNRRHREGLRRYFRRLGVDYASFPTDRDYLPVLHRLLKKHALRKNT